MNYTYYIADVFTRRIFNSAQMRVGGEAVLVEEGMMTVPDIESI
jgi:hypothetical protein